tara:strand:- start:556 stop:1236 length:681 start_codon:yes stop_codon:yes gene_type:complete
MVNVDTVYQRVLALANKEQRGYITPQEFNLFANQAQMETFEQYFYDINQFGRMHGNDTEYSDMLNLLNEKIAIFKEQTTLSYSQPVFQKPPQIYRLGTMLHKGIEIQQVNYNELLQFAKSPLLKPTEALPVFFERNDGYIVKPNSITTNVICTYVKNPDKVQWGYNVIGSNALYDATNTVHFELHRSEEASLVIKILGLAGITLNKPGLMQVGQQLDQLTENKEKQ